jgi:hypothetical protein
VHDAGHLAVPGERLVHRRAVGDRPLDERDAPLDELPVTAREVVQDDHLAAGLEERTDHVRADVPGATGDDPDHAMSLLSCPEGTL